MPDGGRLNMAIHEQSPQQCGRGFQIAGNGNGDKGPNCDIGRMACGPSLRDGLSYQLKLKSGSS